MYPNCPLVVPEVNMDVVTKDTRYICNPNCSTIQMVVALSPLHKAARLRRVVVSTYQSVSGYGEVAMEQLKKETAQVLAGQLPVQNPEVFPHAIAFNCIPHIDKFLPNGYTKEEMKMINETRKIFDEPNLLINATTVRVPVFIGHSESINAEFELPMDRQQAIEILSDPGRSPGVICLDGPTSDPLAIKVRNDPNEQRYPVTDDLAKVEYRDSVLVGRLRNDTTVKNSINLWCVADNLRKGAATNAVQIAEKMLKRGLL